jgi:hypothetical protein
MSAIYVLLEELEIVKAESRAEISHHLTDCSRIIPSRSRHRRLRWSKSRVKIKRKRESCWQVVGSQP